MIQQQEAEKFVKGLFAEVWCERNKNAVSKYYHDQFVGVLNGEEEFTFADVLKRVDYSKNRYENNKVTFHDIFPALNNRIIARFTMTALDQENQDQAIFHFLAIIETKDNKMHRQWAFSNTSYRYKAWE